MAGNIRELRRLNRFYGKTNCRKRKGIAKIRLSDGKIKIAELHWYEGCGYEASLEVRKLYENIPDKEAEGHNQVRIIDESGDDYLYPVVL